MNTTIDRDLVSVEIALALGDNWKARNPDIDGSVNYPSRRLDRADGVSLCLHFGSYQAKGKISISGWYPTQNGQYVDVRKWSNELNGFDSSPEINVSETKDAATIAKDIKRRILPAVEEWHKRVVSAINGANSYAAESEKSARAIIEASGGFVSDQTLRKQDRGNVSVYVNHHHFTAQGDTVRFELADYPIALAVELAKTIKRYEDAHPDKDSE